MKRTLSLRRETLGSLSDSDLTAVVGGHAFTREGGGFSCGGLANCVETLISCACIEVSLHECIDLTSLTCRCQSLGSC